MDTPNKIGVIGLGAMGQGIAGNLNIKGYEVVGFDVRPEALELLVKRGGRAVKSLADLGSECDVIISFVVNDEQTEQIIFSEDGLLAHWSAGSVLITCSTMPPAYVTELAIRLKEHGIDLIDAPVTGGAVGADNGTLTTMAAGAKSIFERVRPVLEAFSGRVFYLGEAGAGSRMKVVNQLLCGVHLAAAGEALAMAQRQGLPLDVTFEILAGGAAGSWMFKDRGPRMIADDFAIARSTIDVFVKDLLLVADAARVDRYVTPLASAALLSFLSMSGRGDGKLDDAAIVRYFKDAFPRTPKSAAA